jgi:hypothetical protein
MARRSLLYAESLHGVVFATINRRPRRLITRCGMREMQPLVEQESA